MPAWLYIVILAIVYGGVWFGLWSMRDRREMSRSKKEKK